MNYSLQLISQITLQIPKMFKKCANTLFFHGQVVAKGLYNKYCTFQFLIIIQRVLKKCYESVQCLINKKIFFVEVFFSVNYYSHHLKSYSFISYVEKQVRGSINHKHFSHCRFRAFFQTPCTYFVNFKGYSYNLSLI